MKTVMREMDIFLSHSFSPIEMAVAWRLQTLAAAHGLTMRVPHPVDRKRGLTTAVRQMVDASELVVGFYTGKLTQPVVDEIRYAIDRGKPVLLVIEEGVALLPSFRGLPHVTFRPEQDPGQTVSDIVGFLKKYRTRFGLKQQESQALGALLGLGLILLLLWLATKSD
jgi:hypothetical protein